MTNSVILNDKRNAIISSSFFNKNLINNYHLYTINYIILNNKMNVILS